MTPSNAKHLKSALLEAKPPEVTEELKECQLCHQILPKSDFYKRKDRDGEYTWTMSYCTSCSLQNVIETRQKNPEHYKEYNKEYLSQYYSNNKDKYQIYYKRYYYSKLSPEKQIKYKQKLLDKYPEIVDQICV
jgi:5'-3' exonuclease